MSELKRTPIYSEHVKLNATIAEYAGYEMPIQYPTGITEEHLTVRHRVGLFDVTHMGEILVEGPDAAKFMSYVFTNDCVLVPDGKVVYGFICYEDGGIVDDLLVYKYHLEKYFLVVNAGNKHKVFAYLVDQAEGFNVQLDHVSESYGQIAIQGPLAEKVLQKITDYNLSEMKPFTFKDGIMVDGISCLVSRTGYTGEDGFEVYSPMNEIVTIWNRLLEVGQGEGIKPIGLGARDTLRFEAALPLYGNELSKDITPIEAGFKFFVKFNHDFIGKEVLEAQASGNLKRQLVGIGLLEKGVVRHGEKVYNENGEEIGFVTTGYVLPDHQNGVANALIDVNYTKLGTPVLVSMRKKLLKAEVIHKKFIERRIKNNQ